MEKILVAGSAGKPGAEIIKVLRQHEYPTRALVRDPLRLASKPAELFIADARKPESLNNSCNNIDVVISALGASLHLGRTKDGATFHTVDYQANLNLLCEAKRVGVKKFIYVSMAGVKSLKGVAYVDEHEAFARELQTSGLDFTVIRPTGFYYIFAEILKMAKRPVMPIVGDGKARTNPIHEADLAQVCVNAIKQTAPEIGAGGPEIYTRRDISEMAAEAWGKQPRFITVSPTLGCVDIIS